MAMTEAELTKIFGTADAFALLAAAFTYPTPELTQALEDGSFVHDLNGSLRDMGIEEETVQSLCDGFNQAVEGKTADELMKLLRPEYTELYYGPGEYRKIFPYESVFRKLEINPSARATMFLTKSTHDVERSMKRSGALPDDVRREPADFFATELDFMRHLFTGYAAASLEDAQADAWKDNLMSFFNTHITTWVPSLFSRTREETNLAYYRAAAECGLLVIDHVDRVVNER